MFRQMMKQWRWRSAAKLYARRLRPQLSRDYGNSAHYTPEQIRARVRRATLAAPYIDLAYAAFLPEESFKQLAQPANAEDYEALNRLLAACKPSKPASWTENPEGAPYPYAGLDSSPPPGHS
jgi:hypothetical protein